MNAHALSLPTIPGFEIIAELGAGGMGLVYLAKRLGPHGFDRLVALKTIRPEARNHEAAREMLVDEARILSRLDHPCIVQVQSLEEVDGALYVVMEYVTGVTFCGLSKTVEARLPPLICASLISRVCRGLHAAHELCDEQGRPLGVVHRDVTPHNLLLTFDGRVKIVDFGIALSRGRVSRETRFGIIKGKPTYLAPEQRAFVTVDRRSDIYSLSIVLYEMLTREKVVGMDTARNEEWAARIWNVPPPSSFADVPLDLEAVVLKGLAPDPADRFQTMREMSVALQDVIRRGRCEDLETFAERELAAELRSHEAELHGGPRTEVVRTGTAIDIIRERPETPTAAGALPEVLSLPITRADPVPADTAEVIHPTTWTLADPAADPGITRDWAPTPLPQVSRHRPWLHFALAATAALISVLLLLHRELPPEVEVRLPDARTRVDGSVQDRALLAAATSSTAIDDEDPPTIRQERTKRRRKRPVERVSEPRPKQRSKRSSRPAAKESFIKPPLQDGLFREW